MTTTTWKNGGMEKNGRVIIIWILSIKICEQVGSLIVDESSTFFLVENTFVYVRLIIAEKITHTDSHICMRAYVRECASMLHTTIIFHVLLTCPYCHCRWIYIQKVRYFANARREKFILICIWHIFRFITINIGIFLSLSHFDKMKS